MIVVGLVPRIELLPRLPTPYVWTDWRQRALALDRLVFDTPAGAPYLPLVWRVGDQQFGMPSYVGQESMRGGTGEAITQIGMLLGSTLAGKLRPEWVKRTPQFLSPSEGLILNNVGGKSGGSFWYELLPSVHFVQLASKYPSWAEGRQISQKIAKVWARRTEQLDGNFDHTSFNSDTGKGSDNGRWREPDASAGVAYLELFEALRSGETKPLLAARRALKSLSDNPANPTYEVLTAYGAQAAAYLNDERGENWDVAKLVNWCFEPSSPSRSGWGMITGRWGGYDVGGLMGSVTDGGGYAFAMNTFLNMATLAPIARYQPKFSVPLAKWILNATNASRLFYRDGLPVANQSSAAWPGDPQNGLAYEGLRAAWEGKSPFAAGDAQRSGWAKLDLALYGSAYVGLLAALVHPTNIPRILRIDLRATDFLPVKAPPTSLFWNPYAEAKTVRFDLGPKPVRPFDRIAKRYLSTRPRKGVLTFKIQPNQAIQIALMPR